MRIAIAGGTGLIGKMIVDAVRSGGDTPIVLARSTGVDLTTGTGLDAALVGASAVIDVSNILTTNKSKAVAFFETATTNLLAAEQRAGITHHVVLSIVGADRVGWGYYLGKRRQEELALSGYTRRRHNGGGQMVNGTTSVLPLWFAYNSALSTAVVVTTSSDPDLTVVDLVDEPVLVGDPT